MQAQTWGSIITVEEVHAFDFKSVYHVLHYLNNCNPARAKSVNLLEREGRSSTDDNPAKWSLIRATVESELQFMQPLQRAAFCKYWLQVELWDGPSPKTRAEAKERHWREFSRPSVDDIAEELGKSSQYTRKLIKRGLEQIEDLFRRKGLIPPDERLYN